MAAVILALKLTLAPSLVAAATRVARRLGHEAGGLVGGLPVVAAPIVLIYALEHGHAFATRAAASTVLGIVSLVVFCVVYVAVAPRATWPVAVLAGWLGFGAATALFAAVHPPLGVSAAGAFAAVVAGSVLLAGSAADVAGAPRAGGDLLAWRLAVTAALVLALTAAAGSLDPWLSGLLAPFPIITAVLAGFTHAHAGARGARELLAGLVPGLLSFTLFFVIVAVALRATTVGVAFALATAASLASHAVLVARLRRAG